MTKPLLLALAALVTSACADATSPTSPTGPTAAPVAVVPAPPPAQAADNLSITSFSVTGQFADGQFRYRPEVTMKETTGARSLTVTGITFSLAGATSQPVEVRMTRAVPAGGVFAFGTKASPFEFSSRAEAPQASVMVSFVDDGGQAGQTTATADVPPFAAGSPTVSLRISAFTVTGFMEGKDFAYWPKLTLTESTGAGSLTVTRLKFQLLGIGATGNVPTTLGAWQVPAGGTLNLFHDLFYGEPAYYITSSGKADEVSVVLSFVDGVGRSSDVSAVATVSR